MSIHSKHFVTLPNGVEAEIGFSNIENLTIEALADNTFFVGYMVQDENCENPMVDSDCMGALYFHPNSRYASSSKESNFYEALGLDSDGEPSADDIDDTDEAMLAWALDEWIRQSGLTTEELEAVHPLGVAAWLADYIPTLESRTEEDACNWAYCQPEAESSMTINDLMKVAKYRLIDSHLYWVDVEHKKAEIAKERYEVPDDAQVLDAYIHSGIALSLSGHGMRCRWDTSSGIAVWKAEGEVLKEVEHRQVPYQIGFIEEVGLRTGRKYNAVICYGDVKPQSAGLFGSWHEAYQELEGCHQLFLESTPDGVTADLRSLGRSRAVRELAKSAIESWNQWANGDCWGVVSKVVHASDGTEVEEEDSCWGFVGHEWAEQELADRLEHCRKAAIKNRAEAEGATV